MNTIFIRIEAPSRIEVPLFLDENELNISPNLTVCYSYILAQTINILYEIFWSQNYLGMFNVLESLVHNLSCIHM